MSDETIVTLFRNGKTYTGTKRECEAQARRDAGEVTLPTRIAVWNAPLERVEISRKVGVQKWVMTSETTQELQKVPVFYFHCRKLKNDALEYADRELSENEVKEAFALIQKGAFATEDKDGKVIAKTKTGSNYVVLASGAWVSVEQAKVAYAMIPKQ